MSDRNPDQQTPSATEPPDRELWGSASVIAHLEKHYGRGGLPSGTVVLMALNGDSVLLGQGRLRGLSPTASPFRIRAALQSVLRPMTADPRGTATEELVLVRFRAGPGGPLESDLWWWSALVSVAREHDVLPADMICRSGTRWLSWQAGGRGTLPAAS